MNSSAAKTASTTSRTLRLARKELREILRDRRTTITLVLMPLLVYPLLGVIMRNGVLSNATMIQTLNVFVGFEDEMQQLEFARVMHLGQQLLQGQQPSANATVDELTAAMQFESRGQRGELIGVLPTDKSAVDALKAGELDLAVSLEVIEHPEARQSGVYLKWNIQKRSNSILADQGLQAIEERLNAINSHYVIDVLKKMGLPTDMPAALATTIVQTKEGVSPLVTFIPLMLVLMTMTGAVYPAIDLTAGERERGTMEILVAAPVSRMALLSGKFVAVLVVALMTATMNLISMFVTLFALGLSGTFLGNVGPAMIVQVVILMTVFAAFFSAVLLSITSVARSFKEAQAYLIPLMLVSLTPGVFSLIPDLEINGLLAVTPLVNAVLMGRDLMQGNVNVLMFAVVLISTAFYGILALGLAARIFGSDAVMSGSAGSWRQLLRRTQSRGDRVELQLAFFCLAIVFPLFIVLGSLPSQVFEGFSKILIGNSFVSVIVFVGVPFLALTMNNIRKKTALKLAFPRPTAWVVAVIAGLCFWPFMYEIEISIISVDRVAFLKEKTAASLELLAQQPLWLKLLSLALVPAVCEEFFFRGFLQNSLRQRLSAGKAIVLSALIFGLFHVIVKDVLFYERLVPSAIMGLILGCTFEKTGSLFPGIALHTIHNGLLITFSHHAKAIEGWNVFVEERTHLPNQLLLGAGIGVIIAVVLLIFGSRSENSGLREPQLANDSP